MDIFKNRLTKKGIWYLFVVCAVPLHIWTMVLFFEDFAWISERTNPWDAIGVGSYGLLVALVESLFVFFFSLILAYFIPKSYSEVKRIGLVGISVLFTLLWAILGQLYFKAGVKLPVALLQLIARGNHPLRVIYGTLFAFIGLTITFLLYFLSKSVKFQERTFGFFERLATLTGLYLFLDFCGLVVIVIRNVGSLGNSNIF